jgi:hypothetical protein
MRCSTRRPRLAAPADGPAHKEATAGWRAQTRCRRWLRAVAKRSRASR